MTQYATLPAITNIPVTSVFNTQVNTLPIFPQTYSANSRLKPVNNTLNHRAYLNGYVPAGTATGSIWVNDGIRGYQWNQKAINFCNYKLRTTSNDVTDNDNYYGFNYEVNYGIKIETSELLANIINPIHLHENGNDQFYAPLKYTLGANSIEFHTSKYHAQPWGKFINQDLTLTFANSINTVNGSTTLTQTITGSSFVVEANDSLMHQLPVNTPSAEYTKVYYKCHFLDPITFAPKTLTFNRTAGANQNKLVMTTPNSFIMVLSIYMNPVDEVLFDSSSSSLLTKLTYSNFNTDDRKLFKLNYNFETTNGTNPLVVMPSVVWDGNLDNPSIITAITPQVGGNHIGLNKRFKFAVGQTWTVKIPIKNYKPFENPSLTGTYKADILSILNYEKNYNPGENYNLYRLIKTMEKLINLATLADGIGESVTRDLLINRVKPQLVERMVGSNNSIRIKYTNTNGHAFLAQSNVLDHTFDEFFNYSGSDRNIHFGLFVKCAAVIAKFDVGFKNTYKNHLDLMIASIFNSVTDTNFVFNSQFDLYHMTSWLSGMTGGRDEGCSGESQSEAMTGITGLIDWGTVTNNNFLRDWGLLMYSMEVEHWKRYRVMDMNALPADRVHASNLYNSKKISLIARVGEGLIQQNALYFYFGRPWQTNLVWGINYLSLSPSILSLDKATLTLGTAIANFYDTVSNGMPIRYQIEVPGTTITTGIDVLCDIATVGSSTAITTATNKLKITIGANGITEIKPNDGINLSKTLSLTDNTVYDVLSSNVTGARIRVFTKPFYFANDWTWGMRADAIRAIDSTQKLPIYNKIKGLVRSTVNTTNLVDQNNETESPAVLMAHLANQIQNTIEFPITNLATNPTQLNFKSVINADNYVVVILDSTNTVVSTVNLTSDEYSSTNLNYSQSITGLANGNYTLKVTAKAGATTIGTAQSFNFIVSIVNPLGGIKELKIIIS